MDIKKEFQKIINKDYKSIDSDFLKELEKLFGFTPKKEEFITVTDGFHKTCGSLFLKECWVRDSNAWAVERDVELISRCDDEHDKDIFVYYDHKKEVCFANELKFRPFSPENPPPVDWPVETFISKQVRYFKAFYKNNIGFWIDGKTSKTADPSHYNYISQFKFLNIEPVED